MGVENLMDPTRIKWIILPGQTGDIVISSRVRLARNLSNVPFPHLLSEQEGKKIVSRSILDFKKNPVFLMILTLYNMNELSSEQKTLLSEMHLISPGLTDSKTVRLL
jgi:protein arginine kinase